MLPEDVPSTQPSEPLNAPTEQTVLNQDSKLSHKLTHSALQCVHPHIFSSQFLEAVAVHTLTGPCVKASLHHPSLRADIGVTNMNSPPPQVQIYMETAWRELRHTASSKRFVLLLHLSLYPGAYLDRMGQKKKRFAIAPITSQLWRARLTAFLFRQ